MNTIVNPKYLQAHLSQKEVALLSTNYPNTETFRNFGTQEDYEELMLIKATLTSVGNIRNKDHLIGETNDFYEWTRIFTPSQCRKLEFATN
jgi:hypothetical protein